MEFVRQGKQSFLPHLRHAALMDTEVAGDFGAGTVLEVALHDDGAVAAIEENTGTMVRRSAGQRSSVKPLVASSTLSERTQLAS